MASAQEVISSFLCPLDHDIEQFLKTKAIKFETASKSRTYLLFDNEAADKGELRLLAYFTLALHILFVPTGFSGNQIKKLDEFSANVRGARISEFPCYLIGQLGKNSAHPVHTMTGDLIMNYALGVIGQANDLAGGRIVLIECEPIEKLIDFYRRHGFEEYDNEPDEDCGAMLQMMRLVYF